jgi:hypothetical protein
LANQKKKGTKAPPKGNVHPKKNSIHPLDHAAGFSGLSI